METRLEGDMSGAEIKMDGELITMSVIVMGHGLIENFFLGPGGGCFWHLLMCHVYNY